MKRIALFLALILSTTALAEDPQHLLGRCTKDQLRDEPYGEWFSAGFDAYTPNPEIIGELKKVDPSTFRYQIFFGTWCGDSRREVPRMLRLLQELGISDQRIDVIGLDREGDRLKRGPNDEEKGLSIYRVPTIIVQRDNAEIGRIIEHPMLSLERDLLTIVSQRDYATSYPVYAEIDRWLEAGLLTDPNVSPGGLAAQIRSKINGEGDLSAVASVLRARGETDAAIKLYATNADLHWDRARPHHRLATILGEAGETKLAVQSAKRALMRAEEDEQRAQLLQLLEELQSEE